MTKIILKQDQSYISAAGGVKFGKAGAQVDADNKFLLFIKGRYELCSQLAAEATEFGSADELDAGIANGTVKTTEKPINQMNKTELIELARANGIEHTDEEFGEMTKAQIKELITK